MTETNPIDLPLDEIREYCATQPIARLSLFGSALRDELRPESDIDLLVEYESGAEVGYFRHAGHELALTDIAGWKIDLRTPQELSQYFRQNVLDSARLIYEKVSGQ